MPARAITTRYGRPALEALREVVGSAKRDDPMAPVTLLVPHQVAGTVARRFLAEGVADGRPGIAGLAVSTLPRLAEQIAAANRSPRRPATRPVVGAAWRSALAAEPGVFAEVADHPATVRALTRAHAELRDLDDAALDSVAATSALTHDLVRLHHTVTDRLGAGWYDTTDLLDAAIELLQAEGTTTGDLGHVVLHLPQDLSRAESRLATVLAGRHELTVVVGLTGVERADRVVRRSLDRIGLTVDAAAPARVAHEVVHASDSDDEVRCVVRELVSVLRTTPAHRVAVLYAATHPYARILHEHLRAAGIASNGAGIRPVDERAVGRGFLGLLRLAGDDLPRADLFTAVAEAPTRAFDGARVPVSRWERLSRSAAVVRGDDWADRLDGHAADVRADLAAEQAADDPSQGRIESYERALEGITGLRAFATTLRARLREGQLLSSWSALSEWALALFHHLYGQGADLASLPADEQHAAVVVESSLRGLAVLDAFESAADLDGLVEVLSGELEAALPRVGTFGEGVLVAPLSAAVGLHADVVFAVGLAEGVYPGRLREDALLLGRTRERSLGQLASHRDGLDAQHRHLLAAFDAAPRVVVSFPRGDLRRSTQRLPSRFLLPTLRALTGDDELAATQWDQGDAGTISGSPSYAASLTSVELPASDQEWRTRALSAGTPLDDPAIDAARAMATARASDAFTRFDGDLTGVEGLPDFADGQRLVAPTALEAYAKCPHAYLVERLLRVRPVEQPEEIITISPLDVGNLVHQTMDDFITEQADALPGHGEPWTGSQRARLLEIATANATEYERRGTTGHARLWDDERARILADLTWMLDDDDRVRAQRGARVRSSELAFGLHGADPVAIPVEQGTVLMRGSADKVDEARDGTLIVTDVKTGGTSSYKDLKDDPVMAGTRLQLPVYAHAARQLLGGDRAEAGYWFVRLGKRDRIEVVLDDDVERRYAETVGTLVASIATGLFPAKAPDSPDFGWVRCAYCNPDGLGHGEVRTQYERKRHDPALGDLVRLVDPESLPGALGSEGDA